VRDEPIAPKGPRAAGRSPGPLAAPYARRVPLLRRTPAAADPDEAATDEIDVTDPRYTPGKGQPTPKRSDARQARRKPVPKTRKEAEKLRRERNREQRRTMRQALASGDERNLPARDRGPARRLARDIVDSRFTLGQYALVAILVLFLLTNTPNRVFGLVSRLLLLLATGVVMAQGWQIAKIAEGRVREQYGADAARGIKSYVFWRSLSARRLRRPPPKVKRGDPV